MGKVVKVAAMVVGAVALVATGVGLAAGGWAAAATAGTATAAAGAATAATALSIAGWAGLAAAGLSTIASLTAKKPGFSAEGSASTFATNPQSGLPYAMGRTRMSGLRVYARTWDGFKVGAKDDVLGFVALLSAGGAIDSIESFTADKETVTFDGAGNAIGKFRDYMGQKIWLGGAMASALALTFGGTTFPDWTPAHKLSGMTHAQWALRFDKEGDLYGAGVPEPQWIGKWVKVYDPRLDSTYPGGAGACRALNEATYVWSDNPYLHALTWALGRWQNGKRTLGIGAPIANVRVADFVEGANIAQANGWKVGGVEWSTDSKWDIFKRILQAGGGAPTKTGAMIGCMVNTPRVSIATVQARHLHDRLSIATTKSRRDRFNTVIPRYVDENSEWAVVSGKEVAVPAYVTQDGGRRVKEIDMPLVQLFAGQQATQPGQLAAYEIVNSREAGPIVFTTGPEWAGLKTGDCVTLDVPDEGLAGQLVLITRKSLDPATGKISFAAETETAAKHAFALGQTSAPPPPFSLTAPDLTPPQPNPALWTVTGGVTGEGSPSITIEGVSDFPSADTVLIQYRRVGAIDWEGAPPQPATAPIKLTIPSLDPVADYEARIAYRAGERDGPWRLLGPVSTGAGALSEAISAIAAASELVAGKSTIFYQTTPPTAAESVENDRWVDEDGGNLEYKRLPGNGILSFGGLEISFGGQTLGEYVWTPAPDSRIAQSLLDAAGAQATADRKVRTFSQETMPTAEGVGDLWYQPSTQYLKRWSGAAWLEVSNIGATAAQITQIGQALTDAANAQATADGKIVTFFQPSAPTGADEGDIWWDSDDGNKVYRFTSGAWVASRDTGIAQAILAAAGAQSTADGKIVTFSSTSTPTAAALGDLWFNPSTNYLKRWNGSAWADISNIGATASQIAQIGQALTDAANAQATADGKVDSFYQPSAPSGASEGDLWFDTDDSNKQYRYTSGVWAAVRDGGVGAAITAAAGAQATADGKVTTFVGESPPTATALGDLWYKASTATLSRWNGSSWAAVGTVGAPSGTNVGNTPATTVEGGANAANNGVNSDGSVKGGKVDTGAIQPNSVNAPYYATLTGDYTLTNTDDNTSALVVVVPNVTAGELLKIVVNVDVTSPDDADGTTVISHTPPGGSQNNNFFRKSFKLDSDGGAATRVPLSYPARVDGAAAGTHTFRLGYRPNGSGFFLKAGSDIEVTRQKR